MRELKFRAWDIEKEKMVDNWQDSIWIEYDGFDGGNSFKVMQFTGLKDSQGKDIYEGDIGILDGQKCIVMCSGPCFYFYGLEPFFNGRIKNSLDFVTDIHAAEMGFFQIIGNVFQNPELVENTNTAQKVNG